MMALGLFVYAGWAVWSDVRRWDLALVSLIGVAAWFGCQKLPGNCYGWYEAGLRVEPGVFSDLVGVGRIYRGQYGDPSQSPHSSGCLKQKFCQVPLDLGLGPLVFWSQLCFALT